MGSKPLLSAIEKNRISEALAEAEKKTSGEIVPMIIRKSDTYPETRWRLATAFSLFVALALYGVNPSLNPIWYLLIQIPAFLLGKGIATLSFIQRPFLNALQVDSEVHHRAIQAFFLNNLHSTKNRTGVLIFVSLLEHRVEILADSGIHSKVQPGTWDQVIRHLLEQIQKENLTEGLCLAIREIGKILSLHFPAQEGDADELPNRALVED